MKEYTIDAKNRKLGRVASETAVFLMGKNSPEYEKNIVPDVRVKIINSSGICIDKNKIERKTYYSHSGYLGNLKRINVEKMIQKKGMAEVIKRAVYGMLPKNKLRAEMIKKLEIK